MSDMPILHHFIFAYIATFGWAIFFNAPKRDLINCGILGAIGWVVFCTFSTITHNSIFSNFMAASIVTLLSEFLARKFKNPTILYIIPGIIPLVPGLGIYNTMLNMIQGNYIKSIEIGTEVVLIAGAIVIGMLIVTSIIKSINKSLNK